MLDLQNPPYFQVEGRGIVNDPAYLQQAPVSDQLYHRDTNIGGVQLHGVASAAKKMRLLDDMKMIRNWIKITFPILWVLCMDPFLKRALLS